jgi:hypothetical protein
LSWGLASTFAASALADPAAPQALPTPEASASAPAAEPILPPPERPFLFATDPSLPAVGHVIVSAGLGNVTANTGEERPVGSGALFPTVGAEVGIFSRLSLYVDAGYLFWQAGATNVSPVTLDAGAHILLTNPTSQNLRLALKTSYGLDFFGNSTLLINAAFAWDYSILRVIASGTASHTFQDGSDPVDVEASVGASVKVPAGFRVGVEGVVTDLEEVASEGAEGGSSAFAGPTLGWEWSHRFQVVAGPAYGGGPNYYQGFLFRAAASANF